MNDRTDKKPEETVEKKKTTNIGLTDIGAENERYLKKLGEYPYLNEDDMAHRREQLFLMVQSGASNEFIDRFIDDDINCTIADLDVIRAVRFLTDEKFLMEKVAGKEMTMEDLKKEIIVYLLSGASQTIKELEKNEEQLRKNLMACSALLKRLKEDRDWVRKTEREHYEQMLSSEKKLMRRKLAEKAKAFKEKEKALKAEIEEMTKMTEMTKFSLHQHDSSDEGTQKTGSPQGDKEQSGLKVFHMWHLKRILASKVRRYNYTPAQMESIMRILELSPTTGQFRKACDPQARVENLQALETYIMVRRKS